jgi:copper(I)-binding protein
MKRMTMLALVTIALNVSLAAAQDKPVTASNAWVRLPADGATSTIAVASIENPGMYAIYVLTATSDAAGKVEFRDTSKNDQPVDEVSVIAYETTYMDPKGLHLYLSDLKRPLKEGDVVNFTLKTDQGVQIPVAAVVKKE